MKITSVLTFLPILLVESCVCFIVSSTVKSYARFVGMPPPTSIRHFNHVSCSLHAAHNFGPASSRDTILYTAERPGNPTSKDEQVESEKVFEWMDFVMKEQSIRNVIALLDENEFSCYDEPGLLAHYEAAGMSVTVQPMRAENACQRILKYIDGVAERGEKVVVHCTGGIGRAGRVAAAWMVHRYNLSPQEATDEVLKQALASGIKRKGNVEMLQEWMSASS